MTHEKAQTFTNYTTRESAIVIMITDRMHHKNPDEGTYACEMKAKPKIFFECYVCHKSFSRLSNLKEHMKLFHFAEILNINAKTERHSDERHFKSKSCDVVTDDKKSLDKDRTRIYETQYKCEFCTKRFKTPSLLKRHSISHSDERQFKCDICASSFKTLSVVKYHMRSHSVERPFQCEKCDSDFKSRYNLKVHMRIHNGEKEFKCNVCSSAFIQKSNLKAHLRTHTGEKPYNCKICLANFSKADNLKVHLRKHTAEKPYKCDTCPAVFSSNIHLRQHKKKVVT